MFIEDVYNFLFNRKIFQDENTILDELSNEMHVNIYCVFSFNAPIMRNMCGTMVITPKSSRMILFNGKLYNYLLNPKNFLNIKNYIMILNFSRR